MNQRQPAALPFLFLTEMWERFGFYIVQGMLVLYMSQAFGLSDSASYTIMGAFSALAYIAPFPGGMLADRWLGFRNAVFWGGALLSVGYGLLALSIVWKTLFHLALATIIVGNGLFKPNVSSLLGSLYEPGDPRREAGFTIFYIGINIGALLSGSSGFIKDHFGWQASFGVAGVGLLLGLVVFWLGSRFLAPTQRPITRHQQGLLLLGCLATIIGICCLLQNQFLTQWLLPMAGLVLLGYLLAIANQEDSQTRRQLLSLIALIVASIIFWMLFLQLFFSATLFIDRLVEKTVLGVTLPTTIFYTLECLFVILLGPLFAWSWQTLSQSQRNPAPFSKFMLAIWFAGCGFLTLAISTYFPQVNQLVSPLWIVAAYCMITIGEMLLSPIGLSAVTTLAPRHRVGMMMGVWFVASGFGGQFAGLLAKLAAMPAQVTDKVVLLAVYRRAFFIYAVIAFAVAGLLFGLQRVHQRWVQRRL